MAGEVRNGTAITVEEVERYLAALFGEDLHAKRILSMANATVGVLVSGSLCIALIGRGIAVSRGTLERSGIKQVDRFLSNLRIDLDRLWCPWAAHVVGDAKEAIINLDWTEFDRDDQSTLMATVQTDHGRAMPLAWTTIRKSRMKGRKNDIEDALLRRLRTVIPRTVNVTIVADRGFADQALYDLLGDLEFGYIIRMRSNILVTNAAGETRPAKDWAKPTGRAVRLRAASVTEDRTPIGQFMVVRDRGMADDWCLAVSDPSLSAAAIKRLYGKRFTCEETFRDLKDPHYGFGLNWSRIKSPERRDRMFLLGALAIALLTLLGRAGEACGMDRHLKVNTVKRRTMSLVKQGHRWFHLIPNMREDRLETLLASFHELVAADPFLQAVFAREE